jgi:hypothetical protein
MGLTQVEEVVSNVPPEVVQRYNLSKDGCTGTVALVVYDSVRPGLILRIGALPVQYLWMSACVCAHACPCMIYMHINASKS